MLNTKLLVGSAALLLACGTMIGCGSADSKSTAVAPAPIDATYRLTEEPADAMGVKEARDAIKDEQEVTLVGRIGGDVDPWVEGQAAFLIVDSELKPCNEQDDDGCATPWDYCCDMDLLPERKAMIKVVDKAGKTIATDARKLLNVKESQTVVVHGHAKRDDAGNLTVLADGVFVRN